MPGINIGAHVMPQQKKLSLRDIFHNLGNKHYVALLGAGVTNERLEDILNREGLPLECKDAIKKAMAGIERIERASKEADILLNEIKRIVYEKVNPDEIKVDAVAIESKMQEAPQNKSVF